MFMAETEDMLPRAAPRPCASAPLGHNSDEIVKPTVPEVSILFGQPPQQQQEQHQQQQHHQHQNQLQQHHQHQNQLQQQSVSVQRPSSFALWKKQILPRVNFSPVLTTELGPATPPAPSGGINSVPICNEYNFLPRTRAFDTDRKSPVQPLASNQNIGYAGPATAHYARESYSTDAKVMSPRLANPSSAAADVLTICASTQTDPEIISPRRDSLPSSGAELSTLVNKQDLRQVLNLLEMMRQDQQQLRQICESLAQQQHPTSSKTFTETETQCELLSTNKSNATVKRITPIVHDYIIEEDELPAAYEVPARVLPQFQSPRAAPPIAQSTGYRANTPKGKQSATVPPVASNVLGTVLPKPSTEKSLVMNELALKYLPQRQINDLMDELRISPTATNNVAPKTGSSPAPLRQVDNFTQSPSNISNASYKYLKKYRLLPEEQMVYDHHMSSPQAIHKMQRAGSPAMSSPQCLQQQPMLDLDNIRDQPKLI